MSSLACLVCSLLLLVQSGGSRVELEIVMEGGGPLGSQQEWLRSLSEVGADSLRMSTARGSESFEIKKSEVGGTVTYKVTGLLTADNRLRLPGGTFKRSDMAGVKTWLAKLKSGGLDKPPEAKQAFGLSSDELVRLHDALSSPTGVSTKGVAIPEVIRSIRQRTGIQISVDSSAAAAIKTEMTVKEELQQTSCGTTLAAIIRPLGLVAVPVKDRGGTKIELTDARDAKEHWPIGWPLEKAPREVAPQLFEFLPVEIDDFPLNETLDAIEAKVKMPFIYDQNALVLNDLELADINVTFPSKRTYYYNVVKRVIGQTRPQMKVELRVDEAGEPFLWLTTYK